MLDIKLSHDEITIITLMRQSAPYAKFTVEKRPTSKKPQGELSRLVTETSTLLKDLLVIDTD